MKLFEIRPASRAPGPSPLGPGMTAIMSIGLLGGVAYLNAYQKGALRGLLFATLIPIVPPL
jgi:hypothetical protein